jgi:hypothetical protein
MAFMVPIYEDGDWYVVETTAGTDVVPADLLAGKDCLCRWDASAKGLNTKYDPECSRCKGDGIPLDAFAEYVGGEPQSWERKRAIGVRLSAPGYMDATEWTLHDTEEEAREYVRDYEEVDPDTGDDLEDEA